MTTARLILELTIREAEILRNAMMSYIPPKDDEMLSMMIYVRINRRLEEMRQ